MKALTGSLYVWRRSLPILCTDSFLFGLNYRFFLCFTQPLNTRHYSSAKSSAMQKKGSLRFQYLTGSQQHVYPKKQSIKLSLCILQKKPSSNNCRKGKLGKAAASLCVDMAPRRHFMNNTIKQSNSLSEILQLSKRLKNGTFSLLREESREMWSPGINLCLRDKDTDDRGVDRWPGWVRAYLSAVIQ